MEREKGRAKGFSDNVTGEKQAKALRAAFPSAIQAKCDRLLSIKRRNTVVPLRFRLFFDSTPRHAMAGLPTRTDFYRGEREFSKGIAL